MDKSVTLATIKPTGTLLPQDWSLHVTLVFRQEEGGWRLVHRYADPLVEGVSLEGGRLTLGRAVEGCPNER